MNQINKDNLASLSKVIANKLIKYLLNIKTNKLNTSIKVLSGWITS